MSKRKILLIVGLVILIGAGGLFFWQQQRESGAKPGASNKAAEELSKKIVDAAAVQAAVDQWLQVNGTAEWSVRVESLDDERVLASHRADERMNIASVYKLFLLQPLAGTVPTNQWADETVNGFPIEGCVDRALRLSDNACAEAIGVFIGWRRLDTLIAQEGYGATSLNRIPPLGSATDTGLLLKRLHKGEIVGGETKDRIFTSLKEPKSAEGIRFGCLDCTVWNKHGEYNTAIDDVAIIEKNGQKYSLVIFSDGGSWEQITDLTKVITDQF